MGVTSTASVVGKCFLSNMNFVRRIIAVKDEQVTFEERGTKPVPVPWEAKEPVSIEQFASDVTLEVAEDFDPETPC